MQRENKRSRVLPFMLNADEKEWDNEYMITNRFYLFYFTLASFDAKVGLILYPNLIYLLCFYTSVTSFNNYDSIWIRVAFFPFSLFLMLPIV